jgi:hypothetical protein
MSTAERFIEITAGMRDQVRPYAAKATALARDVGARLLEQQTGMVKGMIAEGNERLGLLKKAPNVRSAWTQQMKYFDVTRQRLSRDVRGTYAILADAGRDASELAVSSFQQMTGKAPKARHAATKPAAKKAVRAKRPEAAAAL